MKLVYQYMTIFIYFLPASNHLHLLQVENCGSNSRLVVDEDDNGKLRLERVKDSQLPSGWKIKKDNAAGKGSKYNITYYCAGYIQLSTCWGCYCILSDNFTKVVISYSPFHDQKHVPYLYCAFMNSKFTRSFTSTAKLSSARSIVFISIVQQILCQVVLHVSEFSVSSTGDRYIFAAKMSICYRNSLHISPRVYEDKSFISVSANVMQW